jgi:putative addiction module killer protein
MLELRYYVTSGGKEPFAEWFADLEPEARAKVTRALVRMEQGNLSNVKPVGEGVLEFKIDFGPGCGSSGTSQHRLSIGGVTNRQTGRAERAR